MHDLHLFQWKQHMSHQTCKMTLHLIQHRSFPWLPLGLASWGRFHHTGSACPHWCCQYGPWDLKVTIVSFNKAKYFKNNCGHNLVSVTQKVSDQPLLPTGFISSHRLVLTVDNNTKICSKLDQTIMQKPATWDNLLHISISNRNESITSDVS